MNTNRAIRRTLLPLVITGMIFAVFSGSGCVFAPRDPEPPLDTNLDTVTLDDPQDVLTNMKVSLEALTTTAYEASLGDESLGDEFRFLFVANSADVPSDDDSYFDDFDRDLELAAVTKLFQRVNELQLVWSFDENDIDIDGIDSATIKPVSYELTATYVDESVTVFEGSADFTFKRSGNNWYLTLWDETQYFSVSSWGNLRASLDLDTSQ